MVSKHKVAEVPKCKISEVPHEVQGVISLVKGEANEYLNSILSRAIGLTSLDGKGFTYSKL